MYSLMKKVRCMLCTAALLVCGSVQAVYPDHPITLIVTYPPGGTADTVARILAPELSKQLGQTIVVENRGGAGGMIGGASVAKASPDGYTIMLDAANHAQNPALQPKMQFDTLKDFSSVSLLLRVPNVIVVRPDSAIHTVAELIQAGRQKDVVVHYATSGTGSAQHLAGELFNAMTGTHLEYVHYKGGNAGIMDVMSGQVPMMFSSMGLAQQNVKSGKLRMVAVGGEKRSLNMPDIPTVAESGVPGYATYEWNAIYAPAGTPEPVIQRLNQAIVHVLSQPEIKARMNEFGGEVIGSSPAELEAFRRAEIAKWEKLVRDHHLKLD
jgi:tripartite-type tricarboxylate transporter receptor subunit TctC